LLRIIASLIFILSWSVYAHDSSTENAELTLTADEIQFIKNNPEITLAGGTSFEPFLIPNIDGSISGYDVDFAKLITKRTGLKIKFQLGLWQQMNDLAKNRQFDGLSAAGVHRDRTAYFDSSIPYATLTRIVFVPKGNPKQIQSLRDLRGKKVAIQRGNLVYDNVVNHSEAIYFDTVSEMLEAVSSGAVDYTIYDESINYIGRKIGIMSTLQPVFTVGSPFNLVFALRNDRPLLKSIFDKGLASITEEEKSHIVNKWLGHFELESAIQLSDSELLYLSNRDSLRYCINPQRYPIEYLDDQGKHQGISSDLLKLVEAKVGEPFTLNQTSNWSESLAAFRHQDCDFVPLVSANKTYSSNFDFSPTVISLPIVLVTASSYPFIANMDDYADASFAIPRDFIESSGFQQYYPKATLIAVDSIEEGIMRVKNGDVFGYVDLITSVLYHIQKYGELDVQVSSRMPWKQDFMIGYRKDQPELGSILTKAVNALSASDVKRIQTQWMATKHETVIDYTSISLIIMVSLLIILLVLYFYQKIRCVNKKAMAALISLQKTKQELEITNRQLHKLTVTDHLTQIYNRAKLDSEIARELDKAERNGSDLGMILLDIDYFKQVNDSYGHLVGDDVLVEVTQCLSLNIRSSDTLGRWAGEEFIVLCPYTDKNQLMALADRLRHQVERLNVLTGPPVTISLGLTMRQNGDDPLAIVKRVDDALYTAKNNGRNCYIYM
jgi:polar amino acid transport system substrate-binding protein